MAPARFLRPHTRRTHLLRLIVGAVLTGAVALAHDEPTATEGAHDAPMSRDALIQDFLTGFNGGTVPLSEATGDVREFVLEVHGVDREIAPGVEVEQWAFGFPGDEPSVPGPEIRVREGDLVRITLRNTHTQPHSIHPHGITSNAVEGDGVKATSMVMVMPGQEYTYEFVAMQPGTHAYHCHVQTHLHLDMGMYGAIIVEPRDDDAVFWDREYVMTLDEWDADQDPAAPVHRSEPDYFLVNGKAFPDTEAFEVLEEEVALFRITNVGYAPHALHLHGMHFLVIAKDGNDLPQPYAGDTLPILPGERYDILVEGRDGTFPFHDHAVDNVTNAGVYPGGMLALITGSEARRTSTDPRSVYYGREAVPEAYAAVPMHEEAGDDHARHHGEAAPTGDTVEPESAVDADDEVLEGEVEVRIVDFAFDTPVLRIAKGTTVTWTNDDAAPHTATAGLPGQAPDERAFDSTGAAEGRNDMLAQGNSWSYTFDAAGEFEYYCLPHPFMTATVIVEE